MEKHREEAIQLMIKAIDNYHVEGVSNNITVWKICNVNMKPFVQEILIHIL